MKIAELFVNLGIKGSDKTKSELVTIGDHMSEVKSLSLEAKAGILAALYGFQSMMRASGQTGNSLSLFAASTGLSTKSMQQWQYAAKLAGIEAEEMTSAVQAVQKSMTNIQLNKGVPEGLKILTKNVGFDMKRIKDTFYVMDKLKELSRKNISPDLMSHVLGTFGISDRVFGAMQDKNFDRNKNNAPFYTEGQINSLKAANTEWVKLADLIERAFGKFNSKHGAEMVSKITEIVKSIEKLAESLITLSEKLKVFEAVKAVLDSMNQGASGTAGVVDDTKDLFAGVSGDKASMSKWWDKRKKIFMENMDSLNNGNFLEHSTGIKMKSLAPAAPVGSNNNVNVTVHAHGVKDAKDAAKLIKHEVKKAVDSNPGKHQSR